MKGIKFKVRARNTPAHAPIPARGRPRGERATNERAAIHKAEIDLERLPKHVQRMVANYKASVASRPTKAGKPISIGLREDGR